MRSAPPASPPANWWRQPPEPEDDPPPQARSGRSGRGRALACPGLRPAAAPPEAGDDYYAAPWGGSAAGAPRPARGALGTSSGRDYRPGEETAPPWEHTAPPWELPGWDEAVQARRRPHDDNAHPSGPLPRVSSGPLPRVPSEGWPPATSGPLPPVPREPWPAGQSSYPAARHEGGFGGQDDTSYLRTGSGYGGGGPGGGEYPAHGAVRLGLPR